MTDVSGPMRIGAILVAASAVLHLIAPVFGGTSPEAMALVISGVIYAAIAAGLMRGWRLLGYLALLIMMAGAIVALTYIWRPGPVPSSLYGGIFAINWLAVFALFVALWRSPRSATVSR